MKKISNSKMKWYLVLFISKFWIRDKEFAYFEYIILPCSSFVSIFILQVIEKTFSLRFKKIKVKEWLWHDSQGNFNYLSMVIYLFAWLKALSINDIQRIAICDWASLNLHKVLKLKANKQQNWNYRIFLYKPHKTTFQRPLP